MYVIRLLMENKDWVEIKLDESIVDSSLLLTVSEGNVGTSCKLNRNQAESLRNKLTDYLEGVDVGTSVNDVYVGPNHWKNGLTEQQIRHLEAIKKWDIVLKDSDELSDNDNKIVQNLLDDENLDFN